MQEGVAYVRASRAQCANVELADLASSFKHLVVPPTMEPSFLLEVIHITMLVSLEYMTLQERCAEQQRTGVP